MKDTLMSLPTEQELLQISLGSFARRDGLSKSTNPHPEGSNKALYWNLGWEKQPEFDQMEKDSDEWFIDFHKAGLSGQAYMMGEMDAFCGQDAEPSPDYTDEQRAAYIHGYNSKEIEGSVLLH